MSGRRKSRGGPVAGDTRLGWAWQVVTLEEYNIIFVAKGKGDSIQHPEFQGGRAVPQSALGPLADESQKLSADKVVQIVELIVNAENPKTTSTSPSYQKLPAAGTGLPRSIGYVRANLDRFKVLLQQLATFDKTYVGDKVSKHFRDHVKASNRYLEQLDNVSSTSEMSPLRSELKHNAELMDFVLELNTACMGYRNDHHAGNDERFWTNIKAQFRTFDPDYNTNDIIFPPLQQQGLKDLVFFACVNAAGDRTRCLVGLHAEGRHASHLCVHIRGSMRECLWL